MNLLDLPFDSGELPSEQVREIAAALDDASFATAIYAKGKRMLEQRADAWVPRITLIAAHRINRSKEFLPTYEGFLNWMDTQTKKDWHGSFSDSAPAGNIFAQSGLTGLPNDKFAAEFQRLAENIGPADAGPILDVGCGGGLWSLKLAELGYHVIGTEHHAGILAAARENARVLGVEDNVRFVYDDALNSKLGPEYNCSRVLCIGVTACLADDTAFQLLIEYLDRVSRVPGQPVQDRMVVLAGNRWAPVRMTAVNDVLQSDPGNYVLAAHRLFLIELNWWMQRKHLEAIKKLFPNIVLIGERTETIDGTREDFLLQ